MPPLRFVWITLICSIWVHISETFRYLVLLLPRLRSHLADLGPEIPPFNPTVFLIWGGWDTLLTGMVVYAYWLASQKWGHSLKTVIHASLLIWSFFVLLWIGMWNMGLATLGILAIALPLSLLEMVVCALIARLCIRRWQA